MNELKAKLEELARLEEITDTAETEADFDEAYQNEYNAFMAASEMIVKMTDGRIDAKTARTLARTKRNEIINLVA